MGSFRFKIIFPRERMKVYKSISEILDNHMILVIKEITVTLRHCLCMWISKKKLLITIPATSLKPVFLIPDLVRQQARIGPVAGTGQSMES